MKNFNLGLVGFKNRKEFLMWLKCSFAQIWMVFVSNYRATICKAYNNFQMNENIT